MKRIIFCIAALFGITIVVSSCSKISENEDMNVIFSTVLGGLITLLTSCTNEYFKKIAEIEEKVHKDVLIPFSNTIDELQSVINSTDFIYKTSTAKAIIDEIGTAEQARFPKKVKIAFDGFTKAFDQYSTTFEKECYDFKERYSSYINQKTSDFVKNHLRFSAPYVTLPSFNDTFFENVKTAIITKKVNILNAGISFITFAEEPVGEGGKFHDIKLDYSVRIEYEKLHGETEDPELELSFILLDEISSKFNDEKIFIEKQIQSMESSKKLQEAKLALNNLKDTLIKELSITNV